MQIFGVPKRFFWGFPGVFLGSNKTFRVPPYIFFGGPTRCFWGSQEFSGDLMSFGEGPPQQIFGVAQRI